MVVAVQNSVRPRYTLNCADGLIIQIKIYSLNINVPKYYYKRRIQIFSLEFVMRCEFHVIAKRCRWLTICEFRHNVLVYFGLIGLLVVT